MNSNENNHGAEKENVSRHAVTNPKKCREMQKKYGWRLLRIEPSKTKILEFDCVFEGDTEFPNYFDEDDNE